MKKYDKKRYTSQRGHGAGAQVYDSNTATWVLLTTVPTDCGTSSHTSDSYCSSSYDSGSSSDSDGSCGCD